MVQLKDVINTMVRALPHLCLAGSFTCTYRLTNLVSLRKRLPVYHKKSAPKGKPIVPLSHPISFCLSDRKFLIKVHYLSLNVVVGSINPCVVNLVAKLSFSTSKAHGVN
jgi:hypothetical protein